MDFVASLAILHCQMAVLFLLAHGVLCWRNGKQWLKRLPARNPIDAPFIAILMFDFVLGSTAILVAFPPQYAHHVTAFFFAHGLCQLPRLLRSGITCMSWARPTLGACLALGTRDAGRLRLTRPYASPSFKGVTRPAGLVICVADCYGGVRD